MRREIAGLLRQTVWSDRKGAALVEFTVMAPFLLVLGLGVIELGNALYGHQLILAGVRDAARYLSRVDDPNALASDAKQLAVYGEIGGSTKRVSWWNVANVNVAVTSIANPIDTATGERTYRGGEQIQIVRVSTSATYPGVGLLGFLGLGASLSVNAFHEERVIHE
jgi:hypothetical protein